MTQPRIVLIHSPFVGPSTLAPVARTLRGLGWDVAEPQRAAPQDVEPPYYPGLAKRIASQVEADAHSPLVIIAHSGAGGLLPSVAGAFGSRVSAAILVDAILPHPGRSWFQTAPRELAAYLREAGADGRLPPWHRWFPSEVLVRLLPDEPVRAAFCAELEAVPAAYCDEPAPVCANWSPPGCGYLQLSDSYADEAGAASAMGWLFRRDIIHHLATLTHPDRVAASLHSMIRALTDSP